MSRRRFSRRQRAGLYVATDGFCAICGTVLERGFHADHVVPWSKGGRTVKSNGQATCPKCNLSKGSRFEMSKETRPLRAWQQNCLDLFKRHREQSFTLVACPGAGKTFLSSTATRHMLDTHAAKRVMIFSPTGETKRQWARDMDKSGINIKAEWSPGDGAFPRDYHGISQTFAILSKGEEYLKVFEKIVRDKPTMVILDEIHHLSESMGEWGAAAIRALGGAAKILCLSGTPWRESGDAIPFIRYSENGEVLADFTYSYAEAVADGVCRPVNFFPLDGEAQWRDSETMLERSHTFGDELSPRDDGRRIKSAIAVDTREDLPSYVLASIRQGMDLLRSVRISHRTAGGLLLADNNAHAELVADQMRQRFGINPTVVHDDCFKPHKSIEEFRRSDSEWIIAVGMVSEGVDIPRLRVLVILHKNRWSKRLNRQQVGRVIRIHSPEQPAGDAYVVIPNVPGFRDHLDMADEAQKGILMRPPESKHSEIPTEDSPAAPMGFAIPLANDGTLQGIKIPGNRDISAETWHAMDYLRSVIQSAAPTPIDLPSVVLADAVEKIRGGSIPREAPNVGDRLDGMTKEERDEELDREAQRLVAEIARIAGKEHSTIHAEVNQCLFGRRSLSGRKWQLSTSDRENKVARLKAMREKCEKEILGNWSNQARRK